MKKIGFFGGSFDPIHFGHLFLAIQLAEANHLDLVLVCPAFCSPFKTNAQPAASAHHRLEMARLALEGVPRFEVCALEVERGGPSFTINTIRALPAARYHLLLSEESASHFFKWKEADELMRLAPPLIGCRPDSAGRSIPEPLKNKLIRTKGMDISSTEIRDRLAKNLYCGHLIPPKALDYIHRHAIYSSSN